MIERRASGSLSRVSKSGMSKNSLQNFAARSPSISSGKRPRILYLSPPWPYLAIRSRHIARALKEVGDVTVGVVHSEGERWDSNEPLEREFPVAFEFEARPQARRSLFAKCRAALDPSDPYPHGLGVPECDERRLHGLAEDFDLIWFFKLRTANMFAHWNWKDSVLDIDDLPSEFQRTILQTATTLRQRVMARLEMVRWKRRESLLERRFAVLATCSKADAQCLRTKAPVYAIPNGFERPAGEPIRQLSNLTRIGFVGLFDYVPNHEGMRWFIENCWPQIKGVFPDARLRMMGRGSDGPLSLLGSDIDGLGWVNNPVAEIASWSVMIVPVKMGGGTRVKIAEGFSRKCPIVSTPVGAYGYDVQDRRQIRLAESASDFASACIELMKDPSEAARMADRAWSEFLEKWTWDAIAPQVWAAAEDCLRQRTNRGVSVVAR